MTKKDLEKIIENKNTVLEKQAFKLKELEDKIELKNDALAKLNREIDRVSGESLGHKTACETKDDQISTLAFRANKYQTMYIEALNGFMYYEQREKRS